MNLILNRNTEKMWMNSLTICKVTTLTHSTRWREIINYCYLNPVFIKKNYLDEEASWSNELMLN